MLPRTKRLTLAKCSSLAHCENVEFKNVGATLVASWV
jgi:hypothetical protein